MKDTYPELTGLFCVYCVAEYESYERAKNKLNNARVVYNSDSLCLEHFNIRRGHAADFDRHSSG